MSLHRLNMARKMAVGCNYITHPSIMPSYIALMVMLIAAPNYDTPASYKLYVIAIVLFATVVVPAISLFLFKTTGVIKDYTLETRQEQVIPPVIAAICYYMCSQTLHDIYYFPLSQFIFNSLAATFLSAAAITYFRKISLYSAASALAFAIALIFFVTVDPLHIGYIITMAMLWAIATSARLYLGHSNSSEVVIGTLLGFFVPIILFFVALYIAR